MHMLTYIPLNLPLVFNYLERDGYLMIYRPMESAYKIGECIQDRKVDSHQIDYMVHEIIAKMKLCLAFK